MRMKQITEIYECEVTGSSSNLTNSKFRIRRASRAVVLNQEGKIALLYVSKHNYHKLPGGGIEAGEDIITALKREVIEEVGTQIDSIQEIGLVIEYRNQHELLQLSYCYVCQTAGELGEPQYTREESNSGFQLIWISIEDAIQRMENDNPQHYAGQFIKKRELTILMKAKDLLNTAHTKNHKDAMVIRTLINDYIEAYNAFDVDRMVGLLHENIEFRNISSGVVDTETKGIEAFRTLAEQAANLFSKRQQSISKITITNDTAEVELDYEGTLAADLPNGWKAGETVNVKGKSIFYMKDGKLIMIEDYS